MCIADKVDQLFEPWDSADSPGCAVGVVKDGTLVYSRGYGMADLGSGMPLTPRSVFDVCSIAKQFTAACIALLARSERISLDDDVRKYVPKAPSYGGGVTIRHLVHHTSGIRDYIDLMMLAGRDFRAPFGQSDALEIIARQKDLNFEPGSAYLYSNSGYVLLAEVVERVSGQSLKEFAEENIFRPLGMNETYFNDGNDSIQSRKVVGYETAENEDIREDPTSVRVIGDGELWTTVEDLCLWDRSFYDNALGDGKLVDLMLTPGELNSGEETDYGFGLVLGEYKGLKTVHHAGDWVGFRSDMIRFPQQGLTAICLSNLGSTRPTRLTRRIADIYLADHFDLHEFAGDYYNDELQATHQLVVEGTQILLRHNGKNQEPIGAVRADRFRLMGADAHFDRDEHHKIIGFTCNTDRVKNIRFTRMP